MEGEQTKSLLTLLLIQSFFPQVQTPFLSMLSERVHPVSLRMHNKSVQKKSAMHEKTTRGNILQQIRTFVLHMNSLEANKRRSGVREMVTAHKI